MQDTADHPANHLCLAQLRARGWTPALVRDFLDPPDATQVNPYYRTQAKMKLYRLERIEQAEAQEAFCEAKRRAQSRSTLSLAASASRARALVALANELPIDVQLVDDATLLHAALQHYNDYQATRAIELGLDDDVPADEGAPAAFLQRVQLNYVRHRLTHYDRTLARIAGQVGVHEAEAVFRRRVFEHVAAAYPWLSEACARELSRGPRRARAVAQAPGPLAQDTEVTLTAHGPAAASSQAQF